MVYTIFISHTQKDTQIAEAIKRVINDAFEGSIRFFLAVHDLGGGDEWRRSLKENLANCDAIISLLTEHSIEKPWIFIEWSAFWINDKVFYNLITKEIRVSDLISPMSDRQVTTITDQDQVRSFFRSLARDSNHQKGIPFDFADDFVVAVSQAIAERDQELANQSFGRFRDSLIDLPTDDREKYKIAQWFYQQNEVDVARKVVYEIRDDLVKAEITTQLIRVGDLENARLMMENIRAADRLTFVARALIDFGYLDTNMLRSIIDDISKKNQAEMRILCLYLINLGQIDTDLFNYIVGIFTNMAELRKVGEHLIENQLIEDYPDHFDTILSIVASRNQREAEKLLVHLFSINPVLVRRYVDEGLMTNIRSKKRLDDLLG